MARYRLHLLLFILTVFSTLFAGAYYIQDFDLLKDFPANLLPGLVKGVPFSFPLLVILGSHEFAHYYNSRKYGVDATLPYFIPFPNLFGTLGAVIKMKSRIYDRRALIDIGASGPVAGFILSVAVCAVGLSLSHPIAARQPAAGEPVLGSSLLYYLMVKVFVGTDAARQAVDLHPVAVAGWVGLFVTSINLMPVGQLDGGHVAYAFLGRWHRLVSRIFILLLALMGLVFAGWLLWVALLVAIGTKHPPVEDAGAPVGRRRVLVGVLSLVIFIITFSPVPIYINMP